MEMYDYVRHNEVEKLRFPPPAPYVHSRSVGVDQQAAALALGGPRSERPTRLTPTRGHHRHQQRGMMTPTTGLTRQLTSQLTPSPGAKLTGVLFVRNRRAYVCVCDHDSGAIISVGAGSEPSITESSQVRVVPLLAAHTQKDTLPARGKKGPAA